MKKLLTILLIGVYTQLSAQNASHVRIDKYTVGVWDTKANNYRLKQFKKVELEATMDKEGLVIKGDDEWNYEYLGKKQNENSPKFIRNVWKATDRGQEQCFVIIDLFKKENSVIIKIEYPDRTYLYMGRMVD